MNEAVFEKLEQLIGISDNAVPRVVDAQKIRLKENVEYIVSVVAIQDGKVLLMQESKQSCRGRWYLPAGRMKTNESIVDAAKRETLEETGLHVELESLILVERLYSGRWMRFTFAGHVTGGSLKTECDKESMAAGWFTYPKEVYTLPIRCNDMHRLIQIGIGWFTRKANHGYDKLYKSLPVLKSHSYMSVKVIIAIKCEGESVSSSANVQILYHRDYDEGSEKSHLPCHVLRKYESLEEAVSAVLLSCGFIVTDSSCYVHGVVGLEHSGDSRNGGDGLCFLYLVEVKDCTQQKVHLDWFTVEDRTLNHTITELLQPGMCINIKTD